MLISQCLQNKNEIGEFPRSPHLLVTSAQWQSSWEDKIWALLYDGLLTFPTRKAFKRTQGNQQGNSGCFVGFETSCSCLGLSHLQGVGTDIHSSLITKMTQQGLVGPQWDFKISAAGNRGKRKRDIKMCWNMTFLCSSKINLSCNRHWDPKIAHRIQGSPRSYYLSLNFPKRAKA